jgi:hypothetical protein
MKNHHSFGRLLLKVLLVLPLLVLGNLAHGTVISFQAHLSGPAESPPNASPGTGFASVLYDDVAQTLSVNVTFSGLLGNTTASHIHAATALPNAGNAGVATEVPFFDSFPIGVTSGSYLHLFDLTDPDSFNPAYVTANGGTLASATTALVNAMSSEKAYLNIHTRSFPPGEIRGFFRVPDSGTTALLLTMGLGTLVAFARRQKLRTC